MDKNSFSQRLRNLREAFSVSQLKLAEGLGVKQYYVAKWESGIYEPNPTIQQKIANYFKVSPLWLSSGIGHIFNGIVFIPRHLVLPQKRADLTLQRKIVAFICKDGATSPGIIANSSEKPDGMIIFRRDEDLLLFLPYVSFYTSPDTYDLKGAMFGALIDCPHISWDGRIDVSTSYERTAEELYKINPNSSIEEIERILDISIPKRLKETYRPSPLPERDTDVTKIEWEFTAEIKFGHFDGITEGKALEEIMKIEELYNNTNEDQKIYIVKLKRKK